MKTKNRTIVRIAAGGLSFLLIVGLCVNLFSHPAVAVTTSLPRVEEIVNSASPFRILEIVPEEGTGSIGYYVSGQEPISNMELLFSGIGASEEKTGLENRRDRGAQVYSALINESILSTTADAAPLYTSVTDAQSFYQEKMPWDENLTGYSKVNLKNNETFQISSTKMDPVGAGKGSFASAVQYTYNNGNPEQDALLNYRQIVENFDYVSYFCKPTFKLLSVLQSVSVTTFLTISPEDTQAEAYVYEYNAEQNTLTFKGARSAYSSTGNPVVYVSTPDLLSLLENRFLYQLKDGACTFATIADLGAASAGKWLVSSQELPALNGMHIYHFDSANSVYSSVESTLGQFFTDSGSYLIAQSQLAGLDDGSFPAPLSEKCYYYYKDSDTEYLIWGISSTIPEVSGAWNCSNEAVVTYIQNEESGHYECVLTDDLFSLACCFADVDEQFGSSHGAEYPYAEIQGRHYLEYVGDAYDACYYYSPTFMPINDPVTKQFSTEYEFKDGDVIYTKQGDIYRSVGVYRADNPAALSLQMTVGYYVIKNLGRAYTECTNNHYAAFGNDFQSTDGEDGSFSLNGYEYVGKGKGSWELSSGSETTQVLSSVVYSKLNYTNNNWFARFVFDRSSDQVEAMSGKIRVSSVRADSVSAANIDAANLVVLSSGITAVAGIQTRVDLLPERKDQLVTAAATIPVIIHGSEWPSNLSALVSSLQEKLQGNCHALGNVYQVEGKLARNDFATSFSSIVGYEDILELIEYENFLRSQEALANGETADKLEKTVSVAKTIQYIINACRDRRATVDSLRVLALEPSTVDSIDKVKKDLQSKIHTWTGVAEEKIIVDVQSTYEFIGKIDDLAENYQIVYVGANTTKMSTDYRDDDMDGLIYSNIGDLFVVSGNNDGSDGSLTGLTDREFNNTVSGGMNVINTGTSISDQSDNPATQKKYNDLKAYNTYRLSGNDISTVKAQQLIEFAKAGYPVIIDGDLATGHEVGTWTIDFNAIITYEDVKEKSCVLVASPVFSDNESRIVSYQWYKNGVALTGPNSQNAKYTVNDPKDGEKYCCILTCNYDSFDGSTVTAKTKDVVIKKSAGSKISISVYSGNADKEHNLPTKVVIPSEEVYTLVLTSTRHIGNNYSYSVEYYQNGNKVSKPSNANEKTFYQSSGKKWKDGGALFASDTKVCVKVTINKSGNMTENAIGWTSMYMGGTTVSSNDWPEKPAPSDNKLVIKRQNTIPGDPFVFQYDIKAIDENVLCSLITISGAYPGDTLYYRKADRLNWNGNPSWGDWHAVGVDAKISDITENNYIQFRFTSDNESAVYKIGKGTAASITPTLVDNTEEASSFDFTATEHVSLNTGTLDRASQLYKALASVTKYENVIVAPSPSEENTTLKQYIKISKPEIVFEPGGEPVLYSSNNSKNNSIEPDPGDGNCYLTFTFQIKNKTDSTPSITTYDVALYLDTNSNGLFSEVNEKTNDIIVYDEFHSVLGTNRNDKYELKADTVYTVSRQMPSDYAGLIPWKLSVVKNGAEHIHTSVTDYSHIQKDPTTIHVLQIYPTAYSWYNDRKTNIARNQNFVNAFNNSTVTKDFIIQIDTIDTGDMSGTNNYSTFNKAAKNPNSKVSVTTYSYKETDGNYSVKDTGTREFASFNEMLSYYDMLIFGFADSYGDLNTEAAKAAVKFADDGKAILVTHDNNSQYNLQVKATLEDGSKHTVSYPTINSGRSGTLTLNHYFGNAFNVILRGMSYQDRYGVRDENYGCTKYSTSATETGMFATGESLSGADLDSLKTDTYNLQMNNSLAYDGSTESGTTTGRETYSIAYKPGSTTTTLGSTQGYSNMFLIRMSTNSSNVYPTTSGSYQHGLGSCTTNKISQVNKGQITTYPYDINTKDFKVNPEPTDSNQITIQDTHEQYYQLNMNSDEIIVWYCLDAADYGNIKNDVRNNYYIYTVNNITYSGAGHSGKVTSTEAELFVNTMVAAFRTAAEDPKVYFTDKAGSTNQLKHFLVTSDYLYKDSTLKLDTSVEAFETEQNIFFNILDPALIDNKIVYSTLYYSLGTEEKMVIEDGKVTGLNSLSVPVKKARSTDAVRTENGAYVTPGGFTYYVELSDILKVVTQEQGIENASGVIQLYIAVQHKDRDITANSVDKVEIRRVGLFELN